jgi:hypothetical protein
LNVGLWHHECSGSEANGTEANGPEATGTTANGTEANGSEANGTEATSNGTEASWCETSCGTGPGAGASVTSATAVTRQAEPWPQAGTRPPNNRIKKPYAAQYVDGIFMLTWHPVSDHTTESR